MIILFEEALEEVMKEAIEKCEAIVWSEDTCPPSFLDEVKTQLKNGDIKMRDMKKI